MNLPEGKTIDVRVREATVKTFYFQAGEPRRGDILLMHTGGAGASAHMCWHLNFDALVGVGYRVTAPDAPGFGRSKVLGGSPMNMVTFVGALLDHLGIDGAHLVGNSMGGVTAAKFAAEHPERTLSLTLSGGEPRVATDAVRTIGSLGATPRNEFVREMFGKPELTFEDMRRATADFFCNRDHPQVDEVTRRRLENLGDADALRSAKDNAMGQVTRRAGDNSGPDYLSRIQAPAFLLHGRDEPGFYPDEHRAALTEAAMLAVLAIPNCTLTMLPDCGHWPQVEAAHRYNALLFEFLDSI